LELPAFVRVTLNVLLLPSATFPKLKLDALLVRSAVAAIPVPLNEMVVGEAEMLLMTETSPDNAAAALGENTTSNVACFRGPIVRGSEIPLIVIPAALVLACVMVRFDPPSFEMVTDCEAVSPSGTEPKRIDDGTTEMAAAPPDVLGWFDPTLEALVSPIHPEQERIAKNRSQRAAEGMALLLKDFACIEDPRFSADDFIDWFFITRNCGWRKAKGTTVPKVTSGTGE
jgi:hypothetical protein